MTQQMQRWTPAWQVMKDDVLTDENTRTAILGNKSVNALSQLAAKAGIVKLSLAAVHKDSMDLGGMVDAGTTKELETAIMNGVQTVAVSYTIFMVKHEIEFEDSGSEYAGGLFDGQGIQPWQGHGQQACRAQGSASQACACQACRIRRCCKCSAGRPVRRGPSKGTSCVSSSTSAQKQQ